MIRTLAWSLGLTTAAMILMGLGGCERIVTTDPLMQDVVELSGTVLYRERIMLPSPAEVGVALLDAEGTLVADTSFVADQQPPIPFSLQVSAARIDTARAYLVTATLVAEEGNLAWGTPQPVPVLTRGAPSEVELVLMQQRRPEAPLTDPWRQAREQGVAFRAIGQEPPWMLDLYGAIMQPRRLVVTTEYGEHTVDFRSIIRDEDGDGNPRLRASSEDARVEIVIEDRLCRDIMSGEEFEAEVTIRLNDRVLTGCGRSLL